MISADVAQAVVYSCDRGFDLVGSSRMFCTADGTLSEEIPHCGEGVT